MGRWEPGARERLQAAALELFTTRGFEQVTAAEIAQSVGLTERTFFRHFSDKREVLFYGQQQFLQAFAGGVDAAPPDASPLEVIASALHAAASFFPDERRPYSRMRQSVIDQNPALRERELHKLANLAATVAEALRARGIGEPAATLAAQSGATVFGIAFAQWIREGETRSLSDIASDVLHELHTLTGAATGSPDLPIAGTAYEPASAPSSRYGSLSRLLHETHSLTWIRSTPRRSEEEHTAQIDPSGSAATITAAEWPTDQNGGYCAVSGGK
jgi:AcrR family transcriptional regulator